MIGIKKAASRNPKRAAQEPKDWEASYRDLYENAPDMYLSVDSATGRVIGCNRTFLKATGRTRNEVIGRPVFELYHPESRAVARQALKRFIATGRLRNLELVLKRKDGSPLPVSLNSTAVRDKRGRIRHSRSILRDITERQRAEAALRNSEERFRALTDFSPDIISIFDREGRLVFNSAAAEKIHGYRAGELKNRSTFDFIHPEDRPEVTAVFGRLFKVPDEMARVQYRYRNADGTYKWMEAFGRNELANPHLNGIIAISRDITERRQAEEALRERQRHFERLTESIPVPAWTATRDGEGGYCNRRWCEYTGQTPKQFAGLGWLKALHPDDVKKTIAQVAVATRRHDLLEVEYRLRRHDGVYRWHLSRAYAERDASGQITSWFGTTTDIHVQKTAQAELERLIKERTKELATSEEHYRRLFINSRDALLTTMAPSWNMTSANPAAVKMFRAKNVEQLLAAKPWEISPAFQPNGLTSFMAAQAMIRKAMKEGSHFFEWRHRRLDGEEFPASVLLTRIETDGHSLIQATVRDITDRVRLEQEVLAISDHERRRIAQDLHDGLGQLLVGASYLTDSLQKDFTLKPDQVPQRLNRIKEAIHEAIRQARDLARDVQPVEAEPNGLMTALGKLAEQTTQLFGIRCAFKCRQAVLLKNNQTASHLYRIAQEAVTNAIKHGKAKHILIHLTRTANGLNLAVKDDGIGNANREGKAGMGMNIMNYRAGMMGGTLKVHSQSGGGTTVECRVRISDVKKKSADQG